MRPDFGQRRYPHTDFSAKLPHKVLHGSSGRISSGMLVAAVFFHVGFPKAGFKIYNIPFTIPDVIFGLLLIVALFRLTRPFYSSPGFKKCSLLILLGCLYFGFRILYERFYGLRQPFAQDLAEIIPLCVYPLVFIAVVVIVDRDRLEQILFTTIRWSVVIVLVYGMAQKVFGGYAVVIPGLTANWNEAQMPDFLAQKDNMLWGTGILKLTSTYQNGNGLGINLLFLLPVAMAVTRSRSLRLFLLLGSAFVFAMCGSRSAWAGMLALALLALLLAVRKWAHKIALLVLLGVALYLFVFYVPIAHQKVLQADQGQLIDLGGRTEPAAILWQDSVDNPETDVQSFLFGPHGLVEKAIVLEGGGAYEMLYLALYQTGGAVGILIWLMPVVFSMRKFWRYRRDSVVRAVFLGLAAYLFAAIAEGAFWAPPTAFNLWLIFGIGWVHVSALERAAKRSSSTTERTARALADRPLSVGAGV